MPTLRCRYGLSTSEKRATADTKHVLTFDRCHFGLGRTCAGSRWVSETGVRRIHATVSRVLSEFSRLQNQISQNRDMGLSRFLNSGYNAYMHKHKNRIVQKPDYNRDTQVHVNTVGGSTHKENTASRRSKEKENSAFRRRKTGDTWTLGDEVQSAPGFTA